MINSLYPLTNSYVNALGNHCGVLMFQSHSSRFSLLLYDISGVSHHCLLISALRDMEA